MPDDQRAPAPGDPPEYTLYRTGPRLFGRRKGAGSKEPAPRGRPGPGRPSGGRRLRLPRLARGPLTPWRVARWLLALVVGWLLLSVLIFLVSAQTREQRVSDRARAALDGGSFPLVSASNVLVLGSDQRTKKTHEPGASTSGPSRSDVILLVRTGGGHSARLSIPRDTVVSIPGHGRAKINAAYAFGGPALAIRTVKQYLGIPVNHVVEVNFDNFPSLIDAMGGVDYTGGCVVSRINGGFANGGYTLRLKRGTTHLDGKQALALARTRHNDCARGESDLTRARRQQKLFTSMKQRLVSLSGFLRLPFISWNAPPAIRSDMGGLTLMGLFAGLAVGGTPGTQVLKPTGVTTLSDGGVALVVSDAERRRAVARFMAG